MNTPSQSGPATGGKYGKRACPALNAAISPADCGERRGSALSCPAHCPYFPFGTAGRELWLKVDGSWTEKALRRVTAALTPARFREQVERMTVPMGDKALEFNCALHHALNHALFLARNAEGKTLADDWEAAGWSGLNNDERVMMKYRRQGRPTVIEVQRVLDPQTVECIEVLGTDPTPFVVLAPGLAAQAARFSRVLTWLVRYPYASRLDASAVEIPHTIWPQWRAVIAERHGLAGAARPGLSLGDYLAETIVESTNLITTVSEEYRQQMFANLDFHHCVASFRYTAAAAEVDAIFRSKPDFAPDEQFKAKPGTPQPLAAFVWLRRGEAAAFDEQRPPAGQSAGLDSGTEEVGILGNVRMFEQRVLFETFSKRRYTFMRGLIDRYFGSVLQFENEVTRDMATMMAEEQRRRQAVGSAEAELYREQPPAEPAAADDSGEEPPVPPEARRQAIEGYRRRHYQAFLDDAVPALGGLTPRAAAQDPAKRPALVELMKQHLHGLEKQSREEGVDLRIDWVLEELGLKELL